jgi:hypothetical protein
VPACWRAISRVDQFVEVRTTRPMPY